MMLKPFDLIIFDVDSTLVTIEGVDWLAAQKGVSDEVAHLTQQSMDGSIAIEAIFEQKLNMLSPSKSELELIGNHYCKTLTEDSAEVIEALQSLRKEVWLVTGSFEPAIAILAQMLQVPLANIRTNTVYFEDCGCYKAIDATGHLTKQDGKARIVKELGRGKQTAFIGDSVTDLATKPFVDLFVGYTGVITRKKILEEADTFITSPSLSPLLSLILTPQELSQLDEKYHPLVEKAKSLTEQGRVVRRDRLYN
jgi:phosphoserine phosphatase